MASRNADDFDGYRKWLGISEKKRPPSHYELLGISLNEDDPDVILSASQQRRQFVESKRGEGHDAVVSELLYRIDEAETTLLDNEMRRDYDRAMTLFEKRRKNRQVDPYAPRSSVKSRPGKTVGEDSGIVKTFIGIMAVICVGFGSMAWFSFQMPWNQLVKDADVAPAPVQPVVVQPIAQPPVQVPVAPAPIQPAPAVIAEVPVKPDDAAPPANRAEAPSNVPSNEQPRPPNTPPDGFVALFNGKDLSNWRSSDHWTVRDGVLLFDGRGENLVTKKRYGDFQLFVDWKIPPGGDSGIYLRGKPQVQIKDDHVGSGGLYNNKTHPSTPKLRADNPVGEWNTFFISIVGDRVTVVLNDKLVVDNVVMENYPTYVGEIPSHGPIELQYFNSPLMFRNIFIKEIGHSVHRPLPLKQELSKTLTNSIGMQLTLIPSGEFQRGAPANQKDRQEDEGPQHWERITQPYYLGEHEVTKGQFAAFVNAKNYQTDAERDGRGGYGLNAEGKYEQKPEYTWKNGGFTQTDDHPVMNVTWNDAVAFCEWLSAKEGQTYRLPSETQWEYACRAGTSTTFWFGSQNNGIEANVNGNYPYGTKAKGPYLKGTSRVGSYNANAFGLFDMHGNVNEWCSDVYDEKAYVGHGGTTSDQTGAAVRRVFRGGSWFVSAWYSRSANRENEPPDFRKFTVGVRVVMTQ